MTAWNDFLAREGATLDNHAATFAGAPADGAALDTGAVAVPLVHLGLLHSIGPDSEVFLHNLFSNDVGNLAPQAVQWSSFNSPKGRMLANFLAWRASEGHHLLLAADIAQMMAKKLSMYILRSKVKLVDISAERALVGVAGVHAGSCLQRAGLPLPAADMQQTVADGIEVIRLDAQRFIVICAADAGAALFSRLTAAGAIKAGTDTWQLAMIRAGIPLITSATQEEFVAQMLNYELIGGVTFQKRCYPGQEIVARTQYLGKLKKRMYRVALPPGLQPQAGNDLYSPAFGEQSAGKLVNVVPVGNGFEALAVLQSSCAESGEVHYGTTDGPVLGFLDLPYPLP